MTGQDWCENKRKQQNMVISWAYISSTIEVAMLILFVSTLYSSFIYIIRVIFDMNVTTSYECDLTKEKKLLKRILYYLRGCLFLRYKLYFINF